MFSWYIFYGIGVLCAPFVYAISFAYFQRKFALIAKKNYKADRNYSIFLSILSLVTGPVFFLTLYFWLSKRAVYGLKWK